MTTTLKEALKTATAYWATKKGSRVQVCKAETCCRIIGNMDRDIAKLTRKDATELLTLLDKKGLSKRAQADYYQTFRRLLKLNGRDTHDWPNGPIAPRKTREAMSEADFTRLVEWLLERGFRETAEVAVILAATGLRISIELLKRDALRLERGDSYDTAYVRGKGGHERTIPVVNQQARAILVDQRRMDAIRAVPYATHLWRWNEGLFALGIKSRLATPHSLRHKYGTEALERSGGNLVLVQELLGHANPGTTAQYLHVSMDDKAKALQPKDTP